MSKRFTKIVSCLMCLAMLLSIAAPAAAAAGGEAFYDEIVFDPGLDIPEDDAVSIDAPVMDEVDDTTASSLPDWVVETFAADGASASSDPIDTVINDYSGATERSFLFDENWRFYLGDDAGASAHIYDDSAWRLVDLPHDYSIEGEYTPQGEAESGYLIGGIGWYRKSFTIDPSWTDKTISIDFGGVYMDAEVYFNGQKLGEHHYGYNPFSFVLPADLINYGGENTIAVRTDDAVPSSRWYSGAGIYRSVYLTVTDNIHVAKYGTYVTTTNSGAVTVKTTLQNDGASPASVTVEQEIYKLNGSTFERDGAAKATATSDATDLAANGTQEFTQTLNVADPDLWNSWDQGVPNLYVLVTTVQKGGVPVDTYETEFGFRSIDWDVNRGFILNGNSVKLKGVCQHHDQGGLGAEAWYRALERQVDILMDMGCNSIRVTHNPAADELIEICNRKGILIIDELFDGWAVGKNGNNKDFSRFFNRTLGEGNALVGGSADMKWQQFVTERVVNRDKNAPCVIMYSICNEVQEGSGTNGNYATYAREIVGWIQAVDATRFVTRGDNTRTTGTSGEQGGINQAILDAANGMGVIGYNYARYHHDANDGNRPTAFSTAHANGWKLYAAETASHINSRGIYKNFSNKRLTSYDTSHVGWGQSASEGWWYVIQDDWKAGEYVWTGFDYIGEPTPFHGSGTGWVSGTDSPKSSYFGAVDTNGLPKDNFWLYRSMWNDQSHTLHILPTWDRSDLTISNGKVKVCVYTDAPMVKLYLNGTEIGSATSTLHTTGAGHIYRTFETGTGAFTPYQTDWNYSAENTHQKLYATFSVDYAEGTLRAEACDASGNPLGADWIGNCKGRSVVKTTDSTHKLVLEADRDIANDARDLSYVTISVMDSKNEIVNGDESDITVTVSGPGKLMALDNGVQPDHTSYLSNHMKAGAGQLVAIIQSTKENAGAITVTAKADGITGGSVTINTSGTTWNAKDPVSHKMVKQLYVQPNAEPELPTTADVTFRDGSKSGAKTITWDESYDKTQLAAVGNVFVINGILDQGGLNIPVSVGVTVMEPAAAILNYSAATPIGTAPSLPATRPAIMSDGTVLAAQFPVTWDIPAASSWAKEGTVKINGVANVFGADYAVTATIRVAEETITIDRNVAGAAAVLTQLSGSTASGALTNLNDGDSATAWSGTGEVGFAYDTAANLYQIKLAGSSAAPAADAVKIYTSRDSILESAAWTELTATRSVSGNTVTYQLPAIFTPVCIKFAFSAQVSLSEIELMVASSSFTTNSTAVLDDLKINGVSASATQLAAREIKTVATTPVVIPVTQSNVAYTVLPANSDDQVIVVTESEDHAARDLYTVVLGAPEEITADNDSNDYTGEVTAYAPSNAKLPPATDGDASYAAAVDGQDDTYWHSNYTNSPAGSNGGAIGIVTGKENDTAFQGDNYIQLTLEGSTELAALRYLPRQDLNNGRIKKYTVRVSEDETTWTTVASDTWSDNKDWKIAMFDQTVTAKYVRLYAHTTTGGAGNLYMTAAELRVVTPIDAPDLTAATITVTPNEFHWKNVDICPGSGSEADQGTTVTVTLNGEPLVKDVDYILDWAENKDPGTAYIFARPAEGSAYRGAAAATFTIVKADSKITGFVPQKISTQAGIAPTLPDTVWATMDDGHQIAVPVLWPTVDESCYKYPQEHTYTIKGTLQDPSQLADGVKNEVSLTLNVGWSQSVNGISLVTTAGIVPTLPGTVTVQFDDGTEGERAVTWTIPDASAFIAGQTVEVTGVIEGIDRVTAKASVRVASADDMEQGTEDIALNNSEKTYTGSGDSLALKGVQNIFPMALAYFSSGNNNPYQAIQGITSASTDVDKRWSDWESGQKHNPTWLAVAFETSTQGVTHKADQVLTLVPHMANKVKVMFVDEHGNNSSAVTYPKSYKIQYYTGSVENLTFDTTTTYGNGTVGNGRVKNWTNSPLLDDANWADVTPTASYPAVPTTNGQMLEIEFAPVNTAIIRVLCVPQDAANKWVGVQALEVYEKLVPAKASFTVTAAALNTLDEDGSVASTEAIALDSFTEETVTINGEEVTAKVFSKELDADAAIPHLALTVGAADNASVAYTQAARVPGVEEPGASWARAVVTSEDGTSQVETYLVKFTRKGAPAGYFISTDSIPAAELAKMTFSAKGGAAGDVITVSVANGYRLANAYALVDGGPLDGTQRTITNGQFTMPPGNVIFYATVEAVPYQITYDLDGGAIPSTLPSNRTSYTVETETFTLSNPTKSGFSFVGWIGSGHTTPVDRVTIEKGSTGNLTFTAVWKSTSGGGTSSGGTTSSGSGVTAPVENKTTTKTNPDGSTTTTTTTPSGLVSAVTTTPDGAQSAVIQVPANSSTIVEAVMPTLDAAKKPEVKIHNGASRPVALTIPATGSDTVVALRVEADGTETVIPLSVMEKDGLRLKTQPGDQTIRLVDNKKDFVDVPETHWASNAVDFASSRELFNGMDSVEIFAPSAAMNRAMMTTVLWRLAEKPAADVTGLFADVQKGTYYEEAVAWGTNSGVIKGTGSGFQPDAAVTRETLAVMLYRAAGSPTVVDEMPRRFSDGKQVAGWAETAMIWCIQNDIINGRTAVTLAPQDVATRAEVAAMLQRFVHNQV